MIRNWRPWIGLPFIFALGCGGTSLGEIPTPVTVPTPTIPPPPGASDISSKRAQLPLSVAAAERILRETELFVYDDVSRGIWAYDLLVDQPDAKTRFQSLAAQARWAGRLYALSALSSLAPEEASVLASGLSTVTDEIWVREADVVTLREVRELVTVIQKEKLWVQFRRLKGEAARRFGKSG